MPDSPYFHTVRHMANDLTGIEWLATCNKRERALIRRHADVVKVPAGSVLIREGDLPRWYYALLDGELAVSVDGDVTIEISSGESVNELEVMRNELSPATVTTLTDATLLVMGRREFLGMVDEVPGLARRLLMPHIPASPTASRRPSLVPLPAA